MVKKYKIQGLLYAMAGVLSLMLLIAACKEEKLGPSGEGTKPAVITDVSIRNVNGAAVLRYNIPDENTAYVLAEYESRSGVLRSIKSSRFKDSLKVDGFAAAGSYEVTLYAVNDGDVRSDPLKITVSPLEPPYKRMLESLVIESTFGGVIVSYDNPDTAALKVVLLTEEGGAEKLVESFGVTSKSGRLLSRGFESAERKFGLFVRDRYDNYSDTIYTSLTPLYEKQLDKSKFAELTLQGDFNTPNNSSRSRLSNIWDGITANGTNDDFFATVNGAGFPQTFSFDMGVTATLSRFKYYPRSESCCAYKNSPRYFEIWGSNVADGDWSNWTKIVDCEMLKPSGLPDGEYNSVDVAYVESGIDYEIPVGTPAYRYIRFKTLSVWSSGNIAIYELTFWGSE
ncbi:DUF5000 domain-containing lipoprotein [Sphingobacterium sp. LRF_L2]|uniref:DUF5000 domain-containing lipoprotein n=1 Tax=Sphingobacterium sp. LRF_L2 TaxID=3369421 RepID=UPI003F61D000